MRFYLYPSPTCLGDMTLRLLGIGLALLLAGTGSLYGQASDTTDTHTVALRNVSLDDALQAFIERTGADIAYSDDLVYGYRTYCRIQDASAEALLQCILHQTPLDYVRTSGGTFLLVRAAQSPRAKGRIVGTVFDATTGEPLPHANVLLADASAGAATNRAGQFNVSGVQSGPHRLVVTYVGYRTAVDSVWVDPDETETIQVHLTPAPVANAPLIVDGVQQRFPSSQLGRTEKEYAPLDHAIGVGSLDVMHSLGRTAGVALNRPRATLHVQGSNEGDHATRLDGVPIRNPVNLGGLISAFSPEALRRMTVHKAGFDAQHGSYTAGVVELEHNLSHTNTRYAAATGDQSNINARAEHTWGRSGPRTGRGMATLRASTWDLYQDPALRHILSTWTHPDPALLATWSNPVTGASEAPIQTTQPDVRSIDVHAALEQDVSAFHQVSASAYHNSDHLETTVGRALGANTASRHLAGHTHTAWRNTMMQARYDGVFSSRIAGHLQVYGTLHASDTFFGFHESEDPAASNEVDLSDAERIDHTAEENTLNEWGAHAEADVSLTPNVLLSASIEPHYLQGRVHARNRFLGSLDHRVSTWQVGSHVQANAHLGVGTTLTAGTRLTYLAARQSVYAEPRASLRHDGLTTPVGDVSLRLATGLYRQYVVQSEVSNDGPLDIVPAMRFWMPLDATVAPPRTYHTAADLLLAPARSWTLRLETYYKRIARALDVDYANQVHSTPLDHVGEASLRTLNRQDDLLAAGDGHAYGIAVRVQRDAERISGDVTAEFSQTKRRYPNRFNDQLVPPPWAQPVRVATNLDIHLTADVYAVGSWEGIWGRPWGLRRAYYDYLAQTNEAEAFPLDLTRPDDQRLDPFSRLDLGLRTEQRVGGVTLEARTQLVNVLNRANTFDQFLDPTSASSERMNRTLPGRRLFIMVGVRF